MVSRIQWPSSAEMEKQNRRVNMELPGITAAVKRFSFACVDKDCFTSTLMLEVRDEWRSQLRNNKIMWTGDKGFIYSSTWLQNCFTTIYKANETGLSWFLKQGRTDGARQRTPSEKLGHRGHGEKFTPAVENMVTVSLRTHNRAESERTGAFPSQSSTLWASVRLNKLILRLSKKPCCAFFDCHTFTVILNFQQPSFRD